MITAPNANRQLLMSPASANQLPMLASLEISHLRVQRWDTRRPAPIAISTITALVLHSMEFRITQFTCLLSLLPNLEHLEVKSELGGTAGPRIAPFNTVTLGSLRTLVIGDSYNRTLSLIKVPALEHLSFESCKVGSPRDGTNTVGKLCMLKETSGLASCLKTLRVVIDPNVQFQPASVKGLVEGLSMLEELELSMGDRCGKPYDGLRQALDIPSLTTAVFHVFNRTSAQNIITFCERNRGVRRCDIRWIIDTSHEFYMGDAQHQAAQGCFQTKVAPKRGWAEVEPGHYRLTR